MATFEQFNNINKTFYYNPETLTVSIIKNNYVSNENRAQLIKNVLGYVRLYNVTEKL